MKIFWSWQSDNHEKSGRYFVSEILGAVARQLNDLNGIDEALRGDDVGPRLLLGPRSDGILEVEKDLVGGQALRFAQHLG